MADERTPHLYDRIDEKTALLPWYVTEYVNKKMRVMSPRSLLNYCHDYLIFFNWLLSEGFYQGKRTDIPLDCLEKLTPQTVENFLSYLQFRLQNDKFTINRKLSSLKSLFNYLQNVAETDDLKPYIVRNVMAKIAFNKIKEDQETVAQKMAGKILWNDEYEQFRQFVANDYRETVKNNKKLLNFHEQNAIRDTAIVSLILGSGLRLSEVVGLDLSDIDLSKRMARVLRKGNKEQYVFFSEQASLDLEDYLSVRAKKYQIPATNKALFVSDAMGPRDTTRRLSPRAIENLVKKYATAFGKPSLSVHKLRHSFATRYQAENNDIPKLRRQLGHSSIQTTMIYTHLTNDELKKAVDQMDDHFDEEKHGGDLL
ncbi:tyrosine recombinase XerS [Sporolactobacillus spathodeae]|uniref:Site-specific recombinase XerD n=1 Tax=Sporolactobacillus spathodeae TaxID=1465502 RepID=A0ABS2Q9V5_9BACL|nr:tyrosine recombinase XerS [Sporolactobacillus spathodeae]MBM7657954.1 site-specific recombinase XerD [Sporolactobacillus spathodeae]